MSTEKADLAGWKKPAVGALHGHLRKNASYRNLK